MDTKQQKKPDYLTGVFPYYDAEKVGSDDFHSCLVFIDNRLGDEEPIEKVSEYLKTNTCSKNMINSIFDEVKDGMELNLDDFPKSFKSYQQLINKKPLTYKVREGIISHEDVGTDKKNYQEMPLSKALLSSVFFLCIADNYLKEEADSLEAEKNCVKTEHGDFIASKNQRRRDFEQFIAKVYNDFKSHLSEH
jgi:hypothetical protein